MTCSEVVVNPFKVGTCQSYVQVSSDTVTTTFGSRLSSESLKNIKFRIYPSEESEVDCLVMNALVLG